jgi:hypothetical protein
MTPVRRSARQVSGSATAGAPGRLVLPLLDGGLLATAAATAPTLRSPFVSAAAGFTRLTLTVRALPRLPA